MRLSTPSSTPTRTGKTSSWLSAPQSELSFHIWRCRCILSGISSSSKLHTRTGRVYSFDSILLCDIVCLGFFFFFLTLSLCVQEAGRLPPSAGRWRFSPDERARLEVCVHIHPGVLPLPGGERPGQNQEANLDSTFSNWHVILICTHKIQYHALFSSTYLHVFCYLRFAIREKVKSVIRPADPLCECECTLSNV